MAIHFRIAHFFTGRKKVIDIYEQVFPMPKEKTHFHLFKKLGNAHLFEKAIYPVKSLITCTIKQAQNAVSSDL